MPPARTGTLITQLYPGYYVNGPYFIDGRWCVSIRKGYEKIGMYYSRFLMQEHLGHILESTEHVHHKDEDETNDVLSNLEVLTIAEHNDLHKRIYKKEYEVSCFFCDKDFTLDSQRWCMWKRKEQAGANGPFCSKSCAAKYQHSMR